MRFSAKRWAYSDRPSFSSHSVICCMAASAADRHLSERIMTPAHAEVAAEVLVEQHFDIRLIVNHENEQVHARPPDWTSDAATRSRTILNSVNSPGCVSTSIDPACCLTMIS